jgi:hypothetical protein
VGKWARSLPLISPITTSVVFQNLGLSSLVVGGSGFHTSLWSRCGEALEVAPSRANPQPGRGCDAVCRSGEVMVNDAD